MVCHPELELQNLRRGKGTSPRAKMYIEQAKEMLAGAPVKYILGLLTGSKSLNCALDFAPKLFFLARTGCGPFCQALVAYFGCADKLQNVASSCLASDSDPRGEP